MKVFTRFKKKRWRLGFGLIIFIHLFIPAQHVIWKRLDIDAPIGLATGTKITMIAFAPSSVCLGKLASAQSLDYQMAPPKNEQKKCGWKKAVKVNAVANISFRPNTITAQCPLMLASYIWLGEVDKAAQKYLGSPLKKIHHAGTYSCRRQRGNRSGEWSEHAFANAWDITGFELENGQVISVLKDWHNSSSAQARKKKKFLRKARKSACLVFRVVLSPDYNAAHKDHFHLDQGPSLSCH